MKLNRPVYRHLPCFEGMGDKEISTLMNDVMKKNPRLARFPMVLWLIIAPSSIGFAFLVEYMFGLDMLWGSLVSIFCVLIPTSFYESLVYQKRLNIEIEKHKRLGQV